MPASFIHNSPFHPSHPPLYFLHRPVQPYHSNPHNRYLVCEYHPAGNVLEQFTANVHPQLPDDEVPSASDAPTATGQPAATTGPEGGASALEGSVGALWVALMLAVVVIV